MTLETPILTNFTTEDSDRLLGLADQFLENWAEDAVQAGTPDDDYENRQAEWTAIRPLLVAAPTMLAALKGILANFHDSVKTDLALGDFPALKAVADAIAKAETVKP